MSEIAIAQKSYEVFISLQRYNWHPFFSPDYIELNNQSGRVPERKRFETLDQVQGFLMGLQYAKQSEMHVPEERPKYPRV